MEDNVEHSFDEQPSDDNQESDSSHEEGSDEEFVDGNIAAMFVNEENDASEINTSEDEDAGIHVEQNIRDLQKNALRNAFLAANITHQQGNILLQTL